jgi:hypothetical protein
MKAFKRDNQQYLIMALNTTNDEFVWKHTNVTPLKEFVGCYEGKEERSYLVPYSSDALKLALTYNQHSVLALSPLINGKRQCRVAMTKTFPNDMIVEGEFKNVGTMPPQSNNWTYDIETGDYFIIE